MARFRVNIVTRFTGHSTIGSHNITGAAWSPTGQRIASAGFDGTLRIWNVNTQTATHVVQYAHDGAAVTHVAWGITNERIITAGKDRTVRVWDPKRAVATALWLLRPPAYVNSLALNVLGTRVRCWAVCVCVVCCRCVYMGHKRDDNVFTPCLYRL